MATSKFFNKAKEQRELGKIVPNPNSTEFEVNGWQLSEVVFKKLVPVVDIHPFPLDELLLMSGAVAYFKPKLVFEWGTHIGKSARIFYELSLALELDVTIHSIDLPDHVQHGEHPHKKRGMMVRGLEDNVKLHQGDGVNTALKIMKKYKKNHDGAGVLFFVDGDHSYESVRRELTGILKWAPKAAVLLHDTFYQSSGSHYNTGPHKAVNDCLKNNKNYKRVDTKIGLPGMTLLYPVAI
jgi:cephalosporin hydroxylase